MKILRIILLFTALIMMSCSSDTNINFPNNFPNNNCLRGQGVIVSETRTLADFHSITNAIYADILLTQGPKEDITIEAQQNILDQINTQVVNGELIISFNRCVDIQPTVKISITVPEIKNLTLTGVGDFIGQNNFNLTDLNITLTGVGDFNLSGTVPDLDITVTGVGDIKAFDLISDECNILITGVGDAEVFVNDNLVVTISGVGDVYYKGDPLIIFSITGSGGIIDAN